MGNQCASREKMSEAGQTAKEKFYQLKETAKNKWYGTPTEGQPQEEKQQIDYEEKRLRYGQYKQEFVTDHSQISMISQFESTLPLTKIDVDEFERRLKMLATSNSLNKEQIIESFRDSTALREIVSKDSIVQQLLLDELMMDKRKQNYLIAQLLLLANLYCPSNPSLKAQKFFELCQENLDSQISQNDKELRLLFGKMLEITYTFMIGLYMANKSSSDPDIPEEWYNDESKLEDAYDSMFEEFQNAVFKSKTRNTREEFLDELSQNNRSWLQPHYLRQRIFNKVTGIEKLRIDK
ncbi:UNKNOWN [Stylonychia lemnae]|uniref:Uncharacterized protein n=1 Tax=Stylonychia lemnae TaxID=5949 RepID=A0A078A573_STYLE|nr:UNKNOWN [Stylonychia lemnae]|eukprot:CDW77354.1 UNKNOWN [Stylonychia lemnae]